MQSDEPERRRYVRANLTILKFKINFHPISMSLKQKKNKNPEGTHFITESTDNDSDENLSYKCQRN